MIILIAAALVVLGVVIRAVAAILWLITMVGSGGK